MKLVYNGVYHNWPMKQCDRYVEEFAVRLNEGNRKRNTFDRIRLLFRKMVEKTITYEQLVSNQV